MLSLPKHLVIISTPPAQERYAILPIITGLMVFVLWCLTVYAYDLKSVLEPTIPIVASVIILAMLARLYHWMNKNSPFAYSSE